MPNPNPKTDHLIPSQFAPAGESALSEKGRYVRFPVDVEEQLSKLDKSAAQYIRDAVLQKMKSDNIL